MFNLFSKKKDSKEKVMTEKEWHPTDELVDTIVDTQESDSATETLNNQDLDSLPESVVNDYPLESLMYDPAVLGWGSVDEQEALFAALLIYYQPGQSVLDVGAGRADLYDFISRIYQTEFKYKGIDYNPNILEVAKQKYPGVDVDAIDALSLDTNPEYDWVLGSGLFNLADHEDMREYLVSVVDSMYNKAKVGVAFNLMTMAPDGVTPEELAQLVEYNPGDLFNFFVERYNKVLCRTDYMLGDATFLIIK
jgi:2-polyprenyl-3-methyl-5-hydroxy-6-metoxy-1,4-benzoquinol methylase